MPEHRVLTDSQDSYHVAVAHELVCMALQEAMRNQQEPGDVLLTAIWRLAGQVLLDTPDCPVELASAVYTLMGQDPPDNMPLSPVHQVSDRQARTAEALQAVGDTALIVRQHQLAPDAQQQRMVSQIDPQDVLGSSAAAEDPVLSVAEHGNEQSTQRQCVDIMTTVMRSLAQSDLSQLPRSQGAVLQAIGSAMTPVVHCLLQQTSLLTQERNQLRQGVRQLSHTLKDVQQEVHAIRKQQTSDASFAPLMAVALAQVSHLVHGLGQFLAAGSKPATASASPFSSPLKLLASPQLKQVQRRKAAQRVAQQQLQDTETRLDDLQPGQPRPDLSAGAVLAGSIRAGRAEVYPGRNAEIVWTDWMGRCTYCAAIFTCFAWHISCCQATEPLQSITHRTDL